MRGRSRGRISVHLSVASGTECDEIQLRIFPTATPKIDVMDFQIGHCSTCLAAPVVPLQYLSTQLLVCVSVEP